MSAPSVRTTSLVDARDGQCCVRCGKSLKVTAGSRHHRKRRRDGGHIPSNLILLCGSGTTGCHGWTHANPDNARAAGYIVPANGRAESIEIPVLVYWPEREPFQTHAWAMLDDEGEHTHISHDEAQVILLEFGLIEAAA